MWQENINSYTPSSMQFSPSKRFFQHQNSILQKIDFVSTMCIDVHYKYTFQEILDKYFIEWGEFEWLNVDHDVIEQGIIYKIWFINPRFQNIEELSLDLKKNVLDNPSIWPLIFWLVWWLIVFFILLWLSKYTVWKVLFRLNLIWAVILLVFYGFKKWKSLYKKIIKTRNVAYWWFTVNYTKQTDALMLSNDVIALLNKMRDEYRITKFCYTGNCIYLLQDLHDRDWNRLESASKLYSEQEKAALQQRTMDYLHWEEFLSMFML